MSCLSDRRKPLYYQFLSSYSGPSFSRTIFTKILSKPDMAQILSRYQAIFITAGANPCKETKDRQTTHGRLSDRSGRKTCLQMPLQFHLIPISTFVEIASLVSRFRKIVIVCNETCNMTIASAHIAPISRTLLLQGYSHCAYCSLQRHACCK